MGEVLIGTSAVLMPVFLVLGILTYRHLTQAREMTHKERMKSLAMGLPLHPPGPPWAVIGSTLIATAVPFFATLFAWLATFREPSNEEIWVPSMMVAISGIIGGSYLLGKQIAPRRVPKHPELEDSQERKPDDYDPDAYDVVSRRG
jgi:hypothetical protein